jgi:ZIP family zinc transporter
MLATSSFSLIIPALASACLQRRQCLGPAASSGRASWPARCFWMLVDRLLPHEAFHQGARGREARAPEARGCSCWPSACTICQKAWPSAWLCRHRPGGALATGISIQDVPEGMVVALALRASAMAAGTRRTSALSGLVERWRRCWALTVISPSASLLGTGRAQALMLYVINHEIIQSHQEDHETFATGGLMGRLRDHDAAGHCAVGSTATTEKENPGTQGFAGNATGKLLVSDQVMLKDRFTCGRLNCGVSSWQRLCRGWCRCRLAGACY